MQERAEIFLEKFGRWSNREYIAWNNRMATEYRKARGIRKGCQIVDDDDFTQFLREAE